MDHLSARTDTTILRHRDPMSPSTSANDFLTAAEPHALFDAWLLEARAAVAPATPQATLDVAGFARLEAQTAAPVACSGTNAGALAMTSLFSLCSCDGASWVKTVDPLQACAWQ